MNRARVHLIAAARPNFMKVAPLWHGLTATEDFDPVIVHTGQHYDPDMSDRILEDLGLPAPQYHMGIGSGSHAVQTAKVMIAYEQIALADRPDWLVVVGDVNSTVACAMVGAKLGIPLVHLEAGLRSRDREMPEEINRIVTDAVSDVLWTPSPDGDTNLATEGIPAGRITRVGNIMLDSFEMVRPRIEGAGVPSELGLTPGSYGVVTLHRPSNVDAPEQLAKLVAALEAVQAEVPLVFPVHPRTAARLEASGLRAGLEAAGVRLIEPMPYVRFMSLAIGAAVLITDSGGIQEEATYLGIPCLTLRENTERPITVEQGTNQLVRAETLLDAVRNGIEVEQTYSMPELWDGKTAGRCIADLRCRSTNLSL